MLNFDEKASKNDNGILERGQSDYLMKNRSNRILK